LGTEGEAGPGHVLAQAALLKKILFFEVPLARLPSRMSCLPDRAPWILWSCVRLRRSMKRSQNRTVASKTILAFLKESRLP